MRNSFMKAGFALAVGATFGKWFADGCINIINDAVTRSVIKKANDGSYFAQEVCRKCNIDYTKYKTVVTEAKIIGFQY